MTSSRGSAAIDVPLKLRATGLGSGIDKDRADYTVYCGGLVPEPIQYCLARIEARCRNPCYLLGIMLNDLMTAFLVAFAAVTASGLLSRIWEYF